MREIALASRLAKKTKKIVAAEPMDVRNVDESNGADAAMSPMERTAVNPWTWSGIVLCPGAIGLKPC